MVDPFIFRCPATGLNVHRIFDDATPGSEDDRVYVDVRCLACSEIRRWLGRTTSSQVLPEDSGTPSILTPIFMALPAIMSSWSEHLR
jgi:hypothetical protein